MSFTIPIGPYHPALEEPCKVQVTCEGETVRDVALSVQYNFRGVEWLAERRNYQQAVALVERVCGICSNVHTLTFCTAVERLAGLTVSERAHYIRTIVVELERLTSHALWAGIAAEVTGFQTLFMTCFALREQLMDVLENLSGNRVHYGMNCIGGVTRDLVDSAFFQRQDCTCTLCRNREIDQGTGSGLGRRGPDRQGFRTWRGYP